MGRNKILIACEDAKCSFSLRCALRRAVKTTLAAENVNLPCEVNILVTDNEHIHTLNRDFRQIDRPTDVLSFPAQNFIAGDFDPAQAEVDPDSGCIPLGDMMLSLEKAAEQAKEYGHSTIHEMSYLTVHSILHLLGYDHVDEGADKRKMRAREKAVMARLKLQQED